MNITAFKPGITYYARSFCDYDHLIKIKVRGRTAKTITAETMRGVKTFRIFIHEGIEHVRPWGKYSLSPIIGADRIAA